MCMCVCVCVWTVRYTHTHNFNNKHRHHHDQQQQDVVATELAKGVTQCDKQNTLVCWGRNNLGQSKVPENLCMGAEKAKEFAEQILNDTIKATPPPATPRPACVCTPQGCDCLGQVREREQGVGQSRGWEGGG